MVGMRATSANNVSCKGVSGQAAAILLQGAWVCSISWPPRGQRFVL